ncbi:unnamed protein product [Rotaria sordida]|uniref:Uncharacterized protein n=1 Tax=Rotaria sordida TaxID=392033 RepID=A0A819CCY4_9BILA|nr:unnamed protein product [Rotaria sordida]
MQSDKKHKSTNEIQSVSNVSTVVHLRRSKGKIVQDCDIYIGRASGKRLGCWCKPNRHGDILCELFKKQIQQSIKPSRS